MKETICDNGLSIKQNASAKAGSKISQIMKTKIANGDFTPCVTNSWCKSRTYINNIPFRSSWEAYFYLYMTVIERKDIEFEKLRVPYIFNSNKHTYIVDFIDFKNKQVYEIKPTSEKDDERNKSKNAFLIEWCTINKYEFQYISDEWFDMHYSKCIVNDHKNIIDEDSYNKITRNLKGFENANS